MSNTDHDEDYNRTHWTGEAWLGVESFYAPKHKLAHFLSQLRGTRSATLAEARARAAHRKESTR